MIATTNTINSAVYATDQASSFANQLFRSDSEVTTTLALEGMLNSVNSLLH